LQTIALPLGYAAVVEIYRNALICQALQFKAQWFYRVSKCVAVELSVAMRNPTISES
jgi:hypothetical protein